MWTLIRSKRVVEARQVKDRDFVADGLKRANSQEFNKYLAVHIVSSLSSAGVRYRVDFVVVPRVNWEAIFRLFISLHYTDLLLCINI